MNYHSVEEFKKRLDAYVSFYNNERPHTTLNYKTPQAFEQQFYERN